MAEARWTSGDRGLIVREGGDRHLYVRLTGTWRIADGVPLGADVTEWLSGHPVSHVSFDGRVVGLLLDLFAGLPEEEVRRDGGAEHGE